MKNFAVKVDDKEYWVSRSIAAVTYLFAKVNGKWCVLANKRGAGLPTNVGKWNCPSGYLDFGETVAQCAAREVLEETGVKVLSSQLTRFAIDDNPTRSGYQNVLFRYCGLIRHPEQQTLTDKYSEPNEVDAIEWIPMDSIKFYSWVSAKHLSQIKEAYKKAVPFWARLARFLKIK